MGSSLIAYNASDSLQQQFLSALALGETGQSGTYSEGVGGANLSSASTDQYGFPQWAGQGNSHAAGLFQFQPGTWDQLASQFGLNFQNANDQNEGAWYLAEQTYSNATNGGSLEQALQNGQYTQVQQALQSIWPSVSGNAAAPQGLAADLANGTGASISQSSGSANTSGTTDTSGPSNPISDFFVRGGLIIVGGIVIIVALWQLLSNNSSVPSPGDTAKLAAAAL